MARKVFYKKQAPAILFLESGGERARWSGGSAAGTTPAVPV